MNRTCKKCNIEKPQTKEYFTFTYRYKKGERVLFLEHTCKICYAKYQKIYRKEKKNKELSEYKSINYATLDDMIEFAQSLGFKSASYAIDKYGKEQFKQMYYDNRQTKI